MIIDWINVTIPGIPDDLAHAIRGLSEIGMPENMLEGLTHGLVFKPFTDSYSNQNLRLLWNKGQDWSSLQITGTGCKLLPVSFLHDWCDRVTRCDVAWDGLLHHPSHYAELNADARTKSYYTSDTGSTLYIGSRKSDSFVRIYQYNEPHERAGITRCEAEFKRKNASSVSRAVLDGKAPQIAAFVARKARLPPGTLNELDAEPLKMAARGVAGQDGRQRWILCVALPAVKDALKAGLITIDDLT